MGSECQSESTARSKNFHCPLCPKKVRTNGGIRSHIRTHTKEKSYKCSHCNFATAHSTSLKSHQKIHDPSLRILKYKCDLCDYATQTLCKLERHSTVHTGERPFKCEVSGCSFRFSTKEHVKRHLKSHKELDVEEYACQLCNFVTRHKHCLRNHVKVHDDAKPYACDTVPGCSYRTRWPRALETHRKTHFSHAKENQLSCSLLDCKFTTVYPTSLTRHLQLHKQEKSYHCDVCDYRASRKDALVSHKKSRHEVTRVKSLSCPMCPKRFFGKSHLQSHVRAHTGEKPLSCPKQDCGFATISRTHLRTHMDVAHIKERRFRCGLPNCSYRAMSAIYIKYHRKRVHHDDGSMSKTITTAATYMTPLCYVSLQQIKVTIF